MELVQEQRLEQQLVMTQEMKQSLEVLQVSAVELVGIIERESEENPLLEIFEDRFEDIEKNNDSSIDEIYRDEDIYEDIKRISYENDPTADIISKLTSKEENIIDRILKEVRIELKNDIDVLVAEEIVQSVDEKGFLEESPQELQKILLEETGHNIELQKIVEIKEFIKTIEPGGISSKDLSEYLIFQIEKEVLDKKDVIIKILSNYFEDFKRKKIRVLKKELGVNESTLKKIYSIVSRLNPYPLFGYSNEVIDKGVVIPEIIVKEEGGEFEVYLNDKYLPGIRVNNEYYKMISNDEKAINYFKEKAMKVRSLEKCIEQRNITMYRVAKTILEEQIRFFKKGEKYLKPLTLYEVGAKLNLHESTISRVVNNKYMETPRGVFELKYFFSGKVETTNGDFFSVTAVQNIIKEIIKKENKNKPLTDKEICKILKEKNSLKISARTVTNYRETMKILPTYLRKEI